MRKNASPAKFSSAAPLTPELRKEFDTLLGKRRPTEAVQREVFDMMTGPANRDKRCQFRQHLVIHCSVQRDDVLTDSQLGEQSIIPQTTKEYVSA